MNMANALEMSVKIESDVNNQIMHLIDKLAEKSGRSVDEARYCYWKALEGGQSIYSAYNVALGSLQFLNKFGR